MISKKEAKEIWKNYYKDFNTRGYKTIELLIKNNSDNSTVIFHIGQWKEEKKNNTFDYDCIILDENKNITYDESNGKLTMVEVMRAFNKFDKIRYY